MDRSLRGGTASVNRLEQNIYKVRWQLDSPVEAARLISSLANPELLFLAAPMLPDEYGSNILLEFRIC